MSKLFLFMMVSLDGYFEGPNHDLSWHNVDEEFNEYAIEQTGNVGTLLFGRTTYELMRDFWPSEEARKTDPIVAAQMNTTPKVVFSKTLQKVKETEYWKNVRLLSDVNPDEIKKIKDNSKKDVAVYGSSNLCLTFLKLGLLDELRIMVSPVVIGAGTPLFAGLKNKLELKLMDTKTFKNGNVLLTYKPVK